MDDDAQRPAGVQIDLGDHREPAAVGRERRADERAFALGEHLRGAGRVRVDGHDLGVGVRGGAAHVGEMARARIHSGSLLSSPMAPPTADSGSPGYSTSTWFPRAYASGSWPESEGAAAELATLGVTVPMPSPR